MRSQPNTPYQAARFYSIITGIALGKDGWNPLTIPFDGRIKLSPFSGGVIAHANTTNSKHVPCLHSEHREVGSMYRAYIQNTARLVQ